VHQALVHFRKAGITETGGVGIHKLTEQGEAAARGLPAPAPAGDKRIPPGAAATAVLRYLQTHGGASRQTLMQAIEDAGLYEGMGDWRPRYGRFVVKSVD
jgi:hypothetical protein